MLKVMAVAAVGSSAAAIGSGGEAILAEVSGVALRDGALCLVGDNELSRQAWFEMRDWPDEPGQHLAPGPLRRSERHVGEPGDADGVGPRVGCQRRGPRNPDGIVGQAGIPTPPRSVLLLREDEREAQADVERTEEA